MASSIFPAFTTVTASTSSSLPLCRDVAWDFDLDKPILRGGKPVEVTGLEAVKVWVYQALRTQRYAYEMFSTDVGTELEQLIGQAYSADTTTSEATRYITEALEVSDYITGVAVSDLSLSEGTLTATVTVTTIYGEGTVYV